MTNLKLKADGDYEYDSRVTGDAIRVTVGYWKDTRQRGVYLRISPIILVGISFKCLLGNEKATLLMRLPRKSDKVTAAIAELLDPLVPEAAALFEGKGPEAALPETIDTVFMQQQRIRKFGNPGAAIDLLREAMVSDAAAVSALAKG